MARPPQDIPTNAETDGMGGEESTPAHRSTMGGLPAQRPMGFACQGAYRGPRVFLFPLPPPSQPRLEVTKLAAYLA